jgi:type I restriction enzyme S subunit
MGSDTLVTEYGLIASDFTLVRLGELCIPGGGVQTGPFGSQLHASDYVEFGTPIITVEHLGENRILHQELPRVTNEDKERLSKYSLQSGDIVFSRVGSVDRRAIVRDEESGWLFSGRCLRVRPDANKIDPDYLSWFFGLPAFKEHIRRIAVGATMPSLNTKLLSDVPIYLPPLPEQRAIAAVLGALDDKIELNRRMNRTLEAMARALFKSWFVDFDPVRAKMEGRPTGLPEEIEALFVGEMEAGRPLGWGVGSVDDEFDLTMGQSPPGNTYNEVGDGLPFYQGKTDFGFRFPTRRIYCSAPTRFAEAGDTLVSVRAPVGTVNMANERCCVGRGVAAIRHKLGSRSYTYYMMESLKGVFDRFEAEGTVFGSINKKDFHAISIVNAPQSVIHAFEELVFPLDQVIENNERQSATLAALRDALLPKLMSGEVRISHAENLFEVI